MLGVLREAAIAQVYGDFTTRTIPKKQLTDTRPRVRAQSEVHFVAISAGIQLMIDDAWCPDRHQLVITLTFEGVCIALKAK